MGQTKQGYPRLTVIQAVIQDVIQVGPSCCGLQSNRYSVQTQEVQRGVWISMLLGMVYLAITDCGVIYFSDYAYLPTD